MAGGTHLRFTPVSGSADPRNVRPLFGPNNIFEQGQRAKDQEMMNMIIKGIEAGLLDPDQSLVQGTPGGEIFKRIFQTTPPMPVQEETAPTMTYPRNEWISETTPGEDEEAAAFAPRAPMQGERKTGRTTGGFQPQTVEQLKRFVIGKMTRGEEVSPTLVTAAGLQPKTLSAYYAMNPGEAEKLQKIKNDPKLLAIFQREGHSLRRERPNADEAEIESAVLRKMGAYLGGEARTTKDEAAALGTTKAAQEIDTKRRKIEYDHADDVGRLKISQENTRLREKGLDIRQQGMLLDSYTRMFTKLAPEIGVDNAQAFAEHTVMAGKNFDEIDLPPEVIQAAKVAWERKESRADQKLANSNKSVENSTARVELARTALDARITYWEAALNKSMQDADKRAAMQKVSADIRAMAALMRNPNTRAQGEAGLKRILVNELGWTETSPQGFEAAKASIGKMLGLDWGVGELKPPTSATPDAARPPITIPRSGGVRAPGTTGIGQGNIPKTAAEWLKRKDEYRKELSR